MNTTQLHYFLTLSQTLNYSTAAQQLFITQPTLSRSIMALEDEIGTKLFFREKIPSFDEKNGCTSCGDVLY